jgi:hypothetical protein
MSNISESNVEWEKRFSPAFLQARDALLAGEPLPPNLSLTEDERQEILLLARLGRFTHAALHTHDAPEGAEKVAWEKAQKALSRKNL